MSTSRKAGKGTWIAWITLSWLSLLSMAQAASFDCTKAASAIEKLICSNAELSKLDDKLSKTYQIVIDQAPDKAKVLSEQRHWLNKVRSSCQDVNCLKAIYQRRIIALTPDSPADRINAAIPIPKTAQLAWATLIAMAANSNERHELEYDFESKMKIRGLGCALVYKPTKTISNEEIVKQLTGNPCIEKADDSLTDWLGKRRVAQMLRLPPLRPLPKFVPSAVERNLDIQGVRMAAEAGVAALWNYQFLEVFDLQNDRSILKKEGLSITTPGAFSPNGRLLIVSQRSTAAIMDAETGEILTTIFARPDEVYWLDTRVAMFVDASNRGMMLVDFRTGNQKRINFMQDAIFRVAALPQYPEEYIMFSLKSAMRVKVDSSGVDPQVTLVAEKAFKVQNAFRGRGTLCSGGKYFINASRNVALTSTETLDTEVVPLGTFDIDTVMPLPDPDTILLTGILTSNPGFNHGLDHFIYSISNRTLSQANHDEYLASRFIYLPSIKTIGQIHHNTISFIQNILVQPPISAIEFNVHPKVEMPGNSEIPPRPRVRFVAPAMPPAALAEDAPASGDANTTQRADHTGNYLVQLTGQTTRKTIHYNCNKLNIFLNGGAKLDGDVDCNQVTLATNGMAHGTLTGSATNVNVQGLNDQSQLDLTGMTIDSLNIAMVNSGAIGRFKISKSAHVHILQGFGALYFRAEDGADPMPVVQVDQINGPAEIHWCGVKVQVTYENDPPGHAGKVLEDCGR